MRKVTSLLIVLFLFAGGIWGQVPGPNLNEGFEDGIIPVNWTRRHVDARAQPSKAPSDMYKTQL